MAEKKVSVRLSATGGPQVRAELEGVGEAGTRGMGRLSRELDQANARMAAFARRAKIAATAAATALAAAVVSMTRSTVAAANEIGQPPKPGDGLVMAITASCMASEYP
ncbi:MAG: hypothetical protein WAO69_13020, partial [Aestuariivita sp.]